MRRILLPEPQERQLDVLCHPARNKVVICGRRWGKSVAGLLACIEGHGPAEGGFPGALHGANIWWVAPSFPIATLIWRDLKRALRGAWTEKREKEWRIVLPGGGSVTVKSADDPDALRGVGLDGVVLDEAAFMKPEAWMQGIRPALSDSGGWAVFLSTPCGQNWLYDLYVASETLHGWARWQRPTSDNPKIPAEELATAREELGAYVFSQEYEAAFLTPGGGLFRQEWFEHRYVALGQGHYGLPDGGSVHIDSLTRYATVDLAASLRTTADYSVVAVFGGTPDGRLLLLDVHRARVAGPDLVPWIGGVASRWDLGTVWMEKAGFQLALIQQARSEGLPVRELVPDRDKVSRALPVTAALEGGRLLLPQSARWCRDLESELLAFPNGAHDDQVDAVAYGVAVQQQALSRSVSYVLPNRRSKPRGRRLVFPRENRLRIADLMH